MCCPSRNDAHTYIEEEELHGEGEDETGAGRPRQMTKRMGPGGVDELASMKQQMGEMREMLQQLVGSHHSGRRSRTERDL